MKTGWVPMIGLLVSLMAVSGCTIRYGDFTLASTKNIGQVSQRGEFVSGKDCAYFLFQLIPLTGNVQANIKTATDRALEKAEGDLIVDAAIYHKWFFFPYVWAHDCLVVTGLAAHGEFGAKE